MSAFLSFRTLALAVVLASVAVFAVALSCHRPTPGQPSTLTIAHDSTVHAVAIMDSVRSRVRVAQARANIRVKSLAPLRARITLTPNAVLVDGADTLAGPGVGVLGKVIAAQDTTITTLTHLVAVQDTALHADSVALDASRRETQVAVSLIPSTWQRVTTAATWTGVGVLGGLLLHLVLAR